MTQEKYRAMSVSEFFKRNRQIAGFTNPVRSTYQTIRELVENSLDATETHGILPDIKIWVSIVDVEKGFINITVEDNGIGIPPSKVPYAFGKLLYGSKYVERQTRGVFGLGVKAAVLYSQMTTGLPVEVWTTTSGDPEEHYFKIKIDVRKNEPIVLEKKNKPVLVEKHGTKVSITIKGDWGRARSKVIEYIRRTHVLCPYASFYMRYPNGGKTNILKLPRKSDKLPPSPKEIPPHPHGIDVETFKHLIDESKPGTTIYSLLLKFSGVGPTSARDFLRKIGVKPKRKVRGLSNTEIVKIVHEMNKYPWRAPPSSALSPVGEENIVKGLSDLSPEFAVAVTRPPKVYRGHPFIVEAGLAYGGKIPVSEKPILMRYANKIPLLYDEGSDVITKVAYSIDWRRYGVQFPAPLAILVHVAGTKLPFHGLGKEALSDEPELENEVRLALLEAGRKLQRFISRKRREYAEIEKKITFLKYKDIIASSIASIINVPKEEVERSYVKLVESKVS
jgi:DNA topoisomerase-6 subunit B